MTLTADEISTQPSPAESQYLGWEVPEVLNVPQDRLVLRLNFYSESVVMERYEGSVTAVKTVSITDVADALTSQLDFNTGLLPKDVLWMANTQQGRLLAFWYPPHTRILALQLGAFDAPERYHIPMPGMLFLCLAGRPPWVFATGSKRPVNRDTNLFHAPTFNVFEDGRVCPGNHKFPMGVEETAEHFFVSFFSNDGNTSNRSKKYPRDLKKRWADLEGKERYPVRDLVKWGTVKDAMELRS